MMPSTVTRTCLSHMVRMKAAETVAACASDLHPSKIMPADEAFLPPSCIPLCSEPGSMEPAMAMSCSAPDTGKSAAIHATHGTHAGIISPKSDVIHTAPSRLRQAHAIQSPTHVDPKTGGSQAFANQNKIGDEYPQGMGKNLNMNSGKGKGVPSDCKVDVNKEKPAAIVEPLATASADPNPACPEAHGSGGGSNKRKHDANGPYDTVSEEEMDKQILDHLPEEDDMAHMSMSKTARNNVENAEVHVAIFGQSVFSHGFSKSSTLPSCQDLDDYDATTHPCQHRNWHPAATCQPNQRWSLLVRSLSQTAHKSNPRSAKDQQCDSVSRAVDAKRVGSPK